ncbi:MAG: gliding motility protein GldM [Firmicutes bacterium]|nr:gliding motility protein GldM [Bacillota bacterium]MCM1401004.1 gliding motility protein GldM [Bacteroides sp.]MCM1476531.1 gliding motility protein GldM [Bacteroides sp.]
MAQSNTRLSPRQKMINLMYIVLTAMLALNVSSDVLDGFMQVEDGLARTNVNVNRRNAAIYSELKALSADDPVKMAAWMGKADSIRRESVQLYTLIDSLKLAIVHEADGKEGTLANIQNRDDIDAASIVMLDPSTLRGAFLRGRVDDFRTLVEKVVVDSVRRASVDAVLSTKPFQRKGTLVAQNWEEAKFDNQPAVAAITLLTKLQNDVRYAEGEALLSIAALSQGKSIAEITGSEMIANDLNAFVVPESRMVMRGGRYSADIVLAAIDTAARPTVYVGGRPIANGHYEFTPSSSGTFNFSGYIEVPHPDGSSTQHPFTSSYTVLEPFATVSATMMNVLYAGIDNPISISIPGVPQSAVQASMTNGSLTKTADGWVARPANVGTDAVISVSAELEGRMQNIATHSFRVRKLPDPTPYLAIGNDRYKGGKPISKQAIAGAGGLKAAIDDGLLDIQFQVLSFEMIVFDSMGNAIPEVSAGASFSERQRDAIKRLGRGKRFFISRIRAKGPDGIERTLSPMEILVN